MDISPLMVHAEKIEEQKLMQVGVELNKKELMREILPRLDLNSNIRKGSRGCFPTKALQKLQGSTKVKCLHLILRKREVVVPTWRGLHVPSLG